MFTYSSKKLFALCLVFISPFLFTQATSAQTPAARTEPSARQVTTSVLIRWEGKAGIERYRLQVATDAGFNDIVFDQAVVGRQHHVKGLSAGRYFWRIAPAAKETGSFSQPAPVEIKAESEVEVAGVVMPAELGGWRTATGEVLRPVPAKLRAGAIIDLVGVNREGTIYAIDGANGIALWTSRYRPTARGETGKAGGDGSRFAPVILERQEMAASVVVAYDGGVRALRAETGREIWRAGLEGQPLGAATGDLNSDAAPEIVVVTSGPHKFYVLDGATGRILADKKLDFEVVGNPFPLTNSVAIALTDGTVEVRGADGNVVRSAKLGSAATTAPLVVRRNELSLMVVGSREGLMALTLDDLKLMGRIVPEDDVVRGTLTAADLDNDGATEIIMVTQRGRVALVSTVDGNVKWYAEGATDAESAVFADVNADGVLDVIVPGGSAFAVGYSGRDGSLIWKVEEQGRQPQTVGAGELQARALVATPSLNGGGIIVGSDPSRTGLRAVELPKGAIKKAVASSQ